jgi:protein-tyrosine-phosphatase
MRIPDGTTNALASHGVTKVSHRVQLVNLAMMDWADIVFTMGSNHLEALKSLYPNHQKKLRLFLEDAGLGTKDVEDPMGQSSLVFKECCDTIKDGVRRIIGKYAKLTEKPRS